MFGKAGQLANRSKLVVQQAFALTGISPGYFGTQKQKPSNASGRVFFESVAACVSLGAECWYYIDDVHITHAHVAIHGVMYCTGHS